MVGDNGIWLVYQKTSDVKKGIEHRLVGRFAIHGGHISIMEDHTGILERMFPPGPITSRELRRMRSIEGGQSAYWELVKEDDLNQGKHPDLVEELDLGGEAWPQE